MAKTIIDSSNANTLQEITGYNYPDGLMPEAWKERSSPDNIVPDGIWLPEYFNLIGKEIYQKIWDGTELYARSPEDISEDEKSQSHWRTRKRAIKITSMIGGLEQENTGTIASPANFTSSHQVGVAFQNEKQENKAFERKQKIISAVVENILSNEIHPFLIGEHGEKAKIRESWWRERGIRFVFEYGYPNGHPTHGIYISNKKSKRKEIKPKGITCPEGVWSLEAAFLFSEKENGAKGQNRKMGDIVDDLIHFLVVTPDLEVFTISSYDGHKKLIDRNYLRSKNAGKDFLRGFIPAFNDFHVSKEDGDYIFINREQFENYLTDKPIQTNSIYVEEKQPMKKKASIDICPLGTRERNTLYKMIIGMAIKGYAYDPNAKKSNVPKEIEGDLRLLGLEITAETIRNYLNKAYSEFPVSAEKPDS